MRAPLPLRAFGRVPRRRVGLLGGSFNPAHAGHRHISEVALRTLHLDEVWWLVSPQNPLKPAAGMAAFARRLADARALCRHPRLHASDLEQRLGTRFTARTLAALTRRFPRTSFVWLMGADNLAQIPRWEHWQDIFRLVPVAVFARGAYPSNALAGKAAHRFSRQRRSSRRVRCLAASAPPAWAFFHSKLHSASATRIRAERATAKAGAA